MVGDPYKRCDSCGANCDWFGTSDEPCYGSVRAVEEVEIDDGADMYWIHACVGHIEVDQGGKYIPQVEEA